MTAPASVVRDYDGLVAYIRRVETYPFAWSGAKTHDCIRCGLGGIDAQGLPRPPGLPRWRSRRQAQALLTERGGLIAAVDGVYRRIPPALAQRGDIVAAEGPFGPCLGLVEGDLIVSPGATGLVRTARAAAIAAWDVTCPNR